MRKLNRKPGDLVIITADKVENDGLTQPLRCNWLTVLRQSSEELKGERSHISLEFSYTPPIRRFAYEGGCIPKRSRLSKLERKGWQESLLA